MHVENILTQLLSDVMHKARIKHGCRIVRHEALYN